jgi:hypothetical protein
MGLLSKLADPLGLFGNSAKADTSGIAAQQAEEARKEDMRRRVNAMFGLGVKTTVPDPSKPAKHLQPIYEGSVSAPASAAPSAGAGEMVPIYEDYQVGGDEGPERTKQRLVGFRPAGEAPPPTVSVGGDEGPERQRAARLLGYGTPGNMSPIEQAMMEVDDPEAVKARNLFGQEETELAGALRGHQADKLKKQYRDAERALRFGAANTGNTGGSVMADQMTRLNEENLMGGTEIEESIRRAINGLRSSREDARLRSHSLINAGSGEEGVRAASEGLKNAIGAAKSADRERLFQELFQNIAFTKAVGDARGREGSAAALFESLRRPGLGANSTSSRTQSGRVYN